MRAEIIKAIRTCMPIAVGVVPLGLAFGVLMVQTGFDWWWTPIFSIVIYAGSMEFLAISMVTGGVTPAVSALTGFMVNFRHIFYGLTFPRDEIRNRFGRAYSTYALTDESYAVLSALPRGSRPSGAFVFTVQLFCQVLWVVSGIIGALAGQAIPPSVKGLDFALVALFIVLAIDLLPEQQGLLASPVRGGPGRPRGIPFPRSATHGGAECLLPALGGALLFPAYR